MKPIWACFDAAYTASPSGARWPAIDVTATRSADELSSSRGSPARIVWRNPFTLVSIISSSHSGFRSRKSP